MSKPDPIDVVFCFDTTGSMYPCFAEVKRKVAENVKQLFKEVPGIRIGIIAQADYNCAPARQGGYVIQMLDLTDDKKEIVKFIKSVGRTYGTDWPEAYELALHEARRFTWKAGKQKVLVMIGDAMPHEPSWHENTKNLDWRNELALLNEAGVHVYACQAMNTYQATPFWRTLAESSGGIHLNLSQFRHIHDLIMAVCYKQVSNARLIEYQDHVQHEGRMNRDMAQMFGVLSGKKVKVSFKASGSLKAVEPGRFQIFDVLTDSPIKQFAEAMGATFKQGRGFYEFTKTVKVQGYKEVVLEDKESGDLYTGAQARDMIGLPLGTEGRVNPRDAKLKDYNVFIQSTSVNRKLLQGTRFLYEVDDYSSRRAA